MTLPLRRYEEKVLSYLSSVYLLIICVLPTLRPPITHIVNPKIFAMFVDASSYSKNKMHVITIYVAIAVYKLCCTTNTYFNNKTRRYTV